MMRILLVEDDRDLANTLLEVLRRQHYKIDHVADGRAADTALLTTEYNLVVLDVGLPYMNGFEVLKNLRRRGNRTPVLILTARDDVNDRVQGLDLGADDYLTKPFALPEFEARVRALLRRMSDNHHLITVGELCLDTLDKQVSWQGETLVLSVREIAILEALMQKAGQVVLKNRLTQQLSDWSSEIGSNAIEVYIHRLRKKLEPKGITIRTIHGLGYMLELPSAV